MPGRQGGRRSRGTSDGETAARSSADGPAAGSRDRTRRRVGDRGLRPSRDPGGRRAQAEPMGVVLVLAITIAGMSLAVAMGGEVVASTQSQLDTSRAETTMTQLDSQSAMVALGSAGTQRLSLPRGPGSSYGVENDSGWVSVTYRNYETGNDVSIMDRRRMGAVTYENGDERIAYQGGGVWRRGGNGSVMVSPPEFHYRNSTLTFPFVSVRGRSSASDRVVVTKNGTEKLYPDPDAPGFENPLTNGRVWVTVRSEYYEAWGDYFETRTDGEVKYDHANERVRLDLVIPTTYPPVTGGVVSGAPSGTMVINNEAGLDSYNSSVAPYAGDLKHGTPDDTAGKIVVAGLLQIEKADVYGDVVVGKELSFDHNHARLHDGNVSYGWAVDPSDPHASGHWDVPDPDTSRYWMRDDANVRQPDSVLGLIDNRRVTLSDSSENDNDADDDVDQYDDEYDCYAVCRLDGGAYYVDEEMVIDEDLEFNATEENVTLVVDDDVVVDQDVDVWVNGDHRVNVYVEGSVTLDNGASVTNPDDDATQFWLYTNPDERVYLGNGAEFTGAIYGPGVDASAGTEVVLKQNAQVFGGMVGDLRIQNNNARIHYDSALANTKAVTHRVSLPALTYLHVTENRVDVTGR